MGSLLRQGALGLSALIAPLVVIDEIPLLRSIYGSVRTEDIIRKRLESPIHWGRIYRVVQRINHWHIRIKPGKRQSRFGVVEVQYIEEAAETYVVPVMLLEGPQAQQLIDQHPGAVIAEDEREHAAIIVDAAHVPEFQASLLDMAHARRRIRGRAGELQGTSSGQLRRLVDRRASASRRPRSWRATWGGRWESSTGPSPARRSSWCRGLRGRRWGRRRGP